MDCLPLQRSPGPFHYLMHEQAKSLVALQELQHEVGALLEFRDLVMDTFPHLRSKLSAAPASQPPPPRWEPGVRVRRRLQPPPDPRARAPRSDAAVQDSGFGTETSSSSGKEAAAAAGGGKEAEQDELCALLDVIQRKGARLRDEVELLQLRLQGRSPPPPGRRLGALDGVVSSPAAAVRVAPPPDRAKLRAILQELDPVELQRHLLTTSAEKQALELRLEKSERAHGDLQEQLDKVKDENEDLRFQLEEKSIELEGTRARVRVLERLQHKAPAAEERPDHPSSSTESAHDQSQRPCEVPSSPRRRPSKIPLPGARPPAGKPCRGRLGSPSFLPGKSAKDPWKSRGDGSASLWTGGKGRDPPSSGRTPSLSAKSARDSLSGARGRESLGRRSAADSKDASFSSSRDSVPGKRDSSFPSSAGRKSLHHQLSVRRTSSANCTRVSPAGQGECSKTEARAESEGDDSLVDDRPAAGESFSDSLDEELGRLQLRGAVDGSREARPAHPWRSCPSEYFDSIDRSGSADPLQGTCPHEGPADRDSLEGAGVEVWSTSEPRASRW
ncbi:uncharacterized protein LOC134539760 isoform X2 [Bacillus rossius redtenbacheri]